MGLGGLSLNIRDAFTPKAQALIDAMGSTGRTRLHRQIGVDEQILVRNHFLGLQNSRHLTAVSLGAQPTNRWAKAAESVSQPAALSASAEHALISIADPGIIRAVQDVDIRPTEGKYLTIPVAAEAYGQRVMKGENSRFKGGFFFTSKKGNLLYGIRDGKDVHPLYALKEEVRQTQDPTLLPASEQFAATASAATAEYLTEPLAETNKEIQTRQE